MVACIARVLKTGKQGSGLTVVTDWTYKAGWGVGIFACIARVLKTGTLVTDWTYKAVAFYEARGVHLLSVVRYVFMDGTAAGRNAVAKAGLMIFNIGLCFEV